MKQPYTVTIERTTTHTYTVDDCNSPEEAEDIAFTYLDANDEGEVQVLDCQVVDSFPEEEEEE